MIGGITSMTQKPCQTNLVDKTPDSLTKWLLKWNQNLFDDIVFKNKDKTHFKPIQNWLFEKLYFFGKKYHWNMLVILFKYNLSFLNFSMWRPNEEVKVKYEQNIWLKSINTHFIILEKKQCVIFCSIFFLLNTFVAYYKP